MSSHCDIGQQIEIVDCMTQPKCRKKTCFAKALFTRDILAHNIAIFQKKIKKDIAIKRYFFSSKYCSYISKSFQISRKK